MSQKLIHSFTFNQLSNNGVVQLSDKAIKDLRNELINKYGSDFNLSDQELNEIGLLLLTCLAESLKLEVSKKNKFL